MFFFLNICSILRLGSQWGWLPYDLGPAEVTPFVCETPIRETYGILDAYRSIGMFLLDF
jgi:hypothetical protein